MAALAVVAVAVAVAVAAVVAAAALRRQLRRRVPATRRVEWPRRRPRLRARTHHMARASMPPAIEPLIMASLGLLDLPMVNVVWRCAVDEWKCVQIRVGRRLQDGRSPRCCSIAEWRRVDVNGAARSCYERAGEGRPRTVQVANSGPNTRQVVVAAGGAV